MFKNYFKTAIRNLWKNKSFSIINITGLAIGMAGAILILLWIQNELSYDRFHAKKDVLYEAWNRSVFDGKLQCWNSTPKILGPTLKQEFPEIKEMTRANWGWATGFLLANDEKKMKAPGALVDPGFLTMFSFPLLKGNVVSALNNVYSIVITEKLSKKLFGDEEPMNKIIRIDNRDNFAVTGVLKDLPNNTWFDFEYLLPYEYQKKLGWYDEFWGNNSTHTFVELNPNVSEASVNSKIKNITKVHSKGTEDMEVFLHPSAKWHLYSKFENGKIAGGKIETVRLFWIIAGFILLIACINFMNLSTARSEGRAKEVGIRKVSGAGKKLLILQFISESILLSVIAGLVAIIIVQLTLPSFNLLVNKQLFVPYNSGRFWLAAWAFVLFTGIISGSYPAFYLSSFNPVKILKGTFKATNALVTPRKLLVVTQFTFAIFLIISTIIIQKQIRYAEERESGYDKNNLMFHYITGDLGKNYELVRQELINEGIASDVCETSSAITQVNSDTWGIDWAGKDPTARIDFDQLTCRGNFIKTFRLRLVAGRDIDVMGYPTDTVACMFNETAIKLMGLKGNPIGQTIKNDEVTYHIVGVFKDFIIRSPYQPMRPMLVKGQNWDNAINIRFNNNNSTSKNLEKAEQIFKKYNPAYPFEYHFADEEYAKKFNNEQQTKKLAGLFAALAIFISCLGLFGLATYMAENRIKEIGVRKVLGASVSNIIILLSKDFIKLVIIAIAIATPVAWWAMNTWLQNFNYRIEIYWWTFLAAGLLAILIALFTIGYQSIKAAFANPVKSLRTE